MGIDDHSGQAEILCTNNNAYNCAKLYDRLGEPVPTLEFPIGAPGTVEFENGEGGSTKLSFVAFKGITTTGREQTLTFEGAELQ